MTLAVPPERRSELARVTLSVPAIHCASCVWLLEQFWRIDPGVSTAEVDLLRRRVRIDYDPSATSLRRIAERLAQVGYEPVVTPEDGRRAPSVLRRLYLQIAPWTIFAPGICLALVVLAVNLLGDGLRDRLDPRLARRM